MYRPDQIAADGYPHNADKIFRDYYPPIPHKTTRFFNGYGYHAATVRGWDYSEYFHRWGASVTFADGYECYTWPEPPAVGRAA